MYSFNCSVYSVNFNRALFSTEPRLLNLQFIDLFPGLNFCVFYKFVSYLKDEGEMCVCVCVACGARVCGVCGACVRSMCVWGVWCVCGFLSLTWTKL